MHKNVCMHFLFPFDLSEEDNSIFHLTETEWSQCEGTGQSHGDGKGLSRGRGSRLLYLFRMYGLSLMRISDSQELDLVFCG